MAMGFTDASGSESSEDSKNWDASMGGWEDWPLRIAVDKAYSDTDHESYDNNQFAYGTLLFGDDVNLLPLAMALGYSFKSVGTKHDRILLYTPDVPNAFLTLLDAFWTLRPVDYIEEDPTFTEKLPRHRGILSKLHMFNKKVLPYDAVLFVDVSVMVMHNLDDIFTQGIASYSPDLVHDFLI